VSFSPTTSRATRREISQALAKALANRDCGKPEQAASWAAKLVRMLEAEHILHPRFRNRAEAEVSRELPSC
jgi:hypothetical protein